MTITRKHIGKRFSQIVQHGNTVYLAGQVGDGENITDQTKSMLARVDALLAEVGSSKSKILQAIIWVSDMKYFDEMNAVYDAWVDPEALSVRACGEAKLATPKLLVEIIITAATD